MERMNEPILAARPIEGEIVSFELDGLVFAVPHRGDWQEWKQPGADEVPEAEIDW